MNNAPAWLENLDFKTRFKQTSRFTFAEIGLFNLTVFFKTAELWLSMTKKPAKLHYLVFINNPISLGSLEEYLRKWPAYETSNLIQDLLTQLPQALPGWHHLNLLEGQIEVSFFYGDPLQGVTDLDLKVDIWALESKEKSDTHLYTSPGFIAQVRRQSHANTQLICEHPPQDWMQAIEPSGFKVEVNQSNGDVMARVAGERQFTSKSPWFERPPALGYQGVAIVVGAGLAGASVAYELAEAGWKVRVLEANKHSAEGASGNLAGALHPLVTADWNLRSQWYLQGFEATLSRLKPWLRRNKIEGELNGLVHLAVDSKTEQRMQDAIRRNALPTEFVHWVDAHQASDLLGGSVVQPGLYFPQAGWLNPPSVVACCLDHKNIEVFYEQKVQGLTRSDQTHAQSASWNLRTQNQNWSADVVVLAEGAFPALGEKMPIRPLKGQVTHLKPDHQAWWLKRAVCHLGYSAPAPSGLAVTGATFEAPSLDPQVRSQSHQTNLDSVALSLPTWLSAQAEDLTGRVGFRPTTPDHLPIIGGLVDEDWMNSAYLTRSHTQALFKYPTQQYHRGLFVSNGHGARGLMSVFLAAKIIRAEIMGDVLPLPPSLYAATHPARFKIRAWRRSGPIE